MSSPAYMISGGRFSTTATFGTTAFGTTPFGGSGYIPDEIPTFNFGSDDLAASNRSVAAEIVQTRNGVPVSVRPFANRDRWAVTHNALTDEDLAVLQKYFKARTFELLPAGDRGNSTVVRWVGTDFRPVMRAPGLYSMSYEIEEMI